MMKRVTQGHFLLRLILVLILTAAVWAAFTYIPDADTSEKQYEIKDADVAVQLQPDGSLLVQEELEFDFNGSFTGAYRDILLNGDARITDVRVLEDGEPYKPGGNTVLGSFDFPGTFGTEKFDGTSDFDGAGDTDQGDRGYSFLRVVWHYNALDENREFDLVYRVKGAANVRDDVVDVTWTVWGDQWDFWLDSLDASISASSGVAPIRTALAPQSLGVDSKIEGDAAVANVDRVPSGQAVGLRAVFPRKAIKTTGGATVDPGDGLAEIDEQIAASGRRGLGDHQAPQPGHRQHARGDHRPRAARARRPDRVDRDGPGAVASTFPSTCPSRRRTSLPPSATSWRARASTTSAWFSRPSWTSSTAATSRRRPRRARTST